MITKFNTIDVDTRFNKISSTIDNKTELSKCNIPGCKRVFPKLGAHTMPERRMGATVLVPCCKEHFNILVSLKNKG